MTSVTCGTPASETEDKYQPLWSLGVSTGVSSTYTFTSQNCALHDLGSCGITERSNHGMRPIPSHGTARYTHPSWHGALFTDKWNTETLDKLYTDYK